MRRIKAVIDAAAHDDDTVCRIALQLRHTLVSQVRRSSGQSKNCVLDPVILQLGERKSVTGTKLRA